MKKNILVTGATGFLGSHLIKRLIKEGQNVVVLKRSFSDTFRITQELNHIKMYNIDEIPDLSQCFNDQHIDVVIHTATCYGRSSEDVKQIFDTNLRFPLLLLEQAISFHVNLFLNTDTFFNTGKIVSRYLNDYSLSKKQFSEWGRQFASMGRIRFIDASLEHMYGEGDSKSKFIPFLIGNLKENIPELKLTAGEQLRDFIYVDDIVEAYWKIITHDNQDDKDKMYRRYEVGTGKAVSIRDFAILAKSLMHSKTRLNFGAIPYKDGEIMESKADISGLKTLGWLPSISIEEGILKMKNYG